MVVIAHAGDSNDLDYLMELADTGATLGMDALGSTCSTRRQTASGRSQR